MFCKEGVDGPICMGSTALHGVQEVSLLQNFSENPVGLLKSPRLKAKVQRFPHQLSTEPHLPTETCGVIP